MGIAL